MALSVEYPSEVAPFYGATLWCNPMPEEAIVEPTLAEAVKSIHEAGDYITFMHKYRDAVEAAETGTQVLRFFLRHILRQAARVHITALIEARLAPIVLEAKERKCIYFKAHSDLRRHGVTIWFNNRLDVEYSRYVGVTRMWQNYDLYPDAQHACNVAYGFFYHHGFVLWMGGIGKASRSRAGSKAGGMI